MISDAGLPTPSAGSGQALGSAVALTKGSDGYVLGGGVVRTYAYGAYRAAPIGRLRYD